MQLARDAEAEPVDLRRRDAVIGEQIDLETMGQAEMLTTWLDALPRDVAADEATPGRQAIQLLELVGFLLVVAGAVLGGTTVAGWLLADPSQPVNAVAFWSVLVGVQLLLLVGWVLAALPLGALLKLPGVRAAQSFVQTLGRCLPKMAAWLLQRMSSDRQQLVTRLNGIFHQKEWLYRRVRFWLLVQLTQLFALAFNIAAVVTFLAVSYGADPAFGWKSTMLEAETLHRITDCIAAPWASLWPDAALSADQITDTKFTSLGGEFRGAAEDGGADQPNRWRYWWPFLLVSLIGYGLIPRALTWGISCWRMKRALCGVPLDTVELQRLRERLARAMVDSRATTSETKGNGQGDQIAPAANMPQAGSAPLIRWAGVALAEEPLKQLVTARVHLDVVQVIDVGGLEAAADAAAILTAANHDGEHCLVVAEAFEPPVAEYVDFLRELRDAIGEKRTLWVLLYDRTPQQDSKPARDRDLSLWRTTLASLADPWLRVESLVEEEPQPNSN